VILLEVGVNLYGQDPFYSKSGGLMQFSRYAVGDKVAEQLPVFVKSGESLTYELYN